MPTISSPATRRARPASLVHRADERAGVQTGQLLSGRLDRGRPLDQHEALAARAALVGDLDAGGQDRLVARSFEQVPGERSAWPWVHLGPPFIPMLSRTAVTR